MATVQLLGQSQWRFHGHSYLDGELSNCARWVLWWWNSPHIPWNSIFLSPCHVIKIDDIYCYKLSMKRPLRLTLNDIILIFCVRSDSPLLCFLTDKLISIVLAKKTLHMRVNVLYLAGHVYISVCYCYTPVIFLGCSLALAVLTFSAISDVFQGGFY